MVSPPKSLIRAASSGLLNRWQVVNQEASNVHEASYLATIYYLPDQLVAQCGLEPQSNAYEAPAFTHVLQRRESW